jgi:hypothetical protein
LEAFSDGAPIGDPIALENEAGWWKAAVGHLIGEATRQGPGNRAMLAQART